MQWKGILWVLLAIQMATANSALSELAKVPYLLQHFNMHRQNNPDDNFADYLSLHYRNYRHLHSDVKHKGLPLQNTATHTAFVVIFPLEAPSIERDLFLLQVTKAKAPLCADAFCLAGFPTALFRPPSC